MFLIPVAVHLFLLKEDKILLLRRHNTGYEDGNYSTVAGHVDGGEQLKIAMIRETKEEVGIEIMPEDLEIVGVMHSITDKEYISFFLKALDWSGEIKNMEPDQCSHLTWFDKLTTYPRTSFHTSDKQSKTTAPAIGSAALVGLEPNVEFH